MEKDELKDLLKNDVPDVEFDAKEILNACKRQKGRVSVFKLTYVFLPVIMLLTVVVLVGEIISTNIPKKQAGIVVDDYIPISSIDKGERVTYYLYESIDRVKHNSASFFLAKLSSVKYVLCLYGKKEDIYVYESGMKGYNYNSEKGIKVRYDDIYQVGEYYNGKELCAIFLVHEWTVEKDIMTDEFINQVFLYYEPFTTQYKYEKKRESDIKEDYFIIFKNADYLYLPNSEGLDSYIRHGYVYKLLKEDTKLYVLLNYQNRSYRNDELISCSNSLMAMAGDYYEEIEEALVMEDDFSHPLYISYLMVDDGDLIVYYDWVKLTVDDFVSIIK